jgi:hypothetical protein
VRGRSSKDLRSGEIGVDLGHEGEDDKLGFLGIARNFCNVLW